MIPKSIQSLKSVEKPAYAPYRAGDPVATMRERFIHSLQAQIALLTTTDPDAKGRRWFQEVNGKYRFSFRYRNSPIEFDDKAFFEVNTKDAVAKTFRSAIKEVTDGEWDALLEGKRSTMVRAGKKKASVEQ